jgi:hypothetical protein
MPVNIDFLPQQNITNGILDAIHLANQHSEQLNAQKIQQQNSDSARMEAQTAADHLTASKPLIAAQATREQLGARADALRLAQEQNAQQYVLGDSTGTQPHPAVGQALGNLIHPDVSISAPAPAVTPAPAPDQLNVATGGAGQTLAEPTALVSTDTSATPPPNGSVPPAKGIAPVDRDTTEAIRLAGGVSPSELSQIQFLRQQLGFNPSHDGVVNYMNGLHELLQKRLTDPTTAASIAFQRAGLDETSARAAAVRNTNIAGQLDKMDADPAVLSDKAPTAIAQLKGILATPNLTPDVRDHAQRNLAVAQQAQTNALAFDAAKKRTEDDIANGDPKQLAVLLNNGDAAWSQLVSTRKPEFLSKVIVAWKALNPNASVAQNEAEYKRATDPQVRNTLDLITTMTDRSGSIAIAEKAASHLPQLNSQQANAVFNLASRSFGDNSVTNFHTAMLGLADEYSKVMGGGVATDSGRAQALDLLKDSYSNGQLSGAIATMKQDIAARKNELVRGNRTLERTYGPGGTKDEGNSSQGPVQSGPPQGATHTGVSSVDGKTYYLGANNEKLGLVQ